MDKINIFIIILCLINIYILIQFEKYEIISSWNDLKTDIQVFIVINFILTLFIVGYMFLYISRQTLNNSLLLFTNLCILLIFSITNLIIATNPYNLNNPNKFVKWIYGIQILFFIYLLILYNKYLIINGTLLELTNYIKNNHPDYLSCTDKFPNNNLLL